MRKIFLVFLVYIGIIEFSFSQKNYHDGVLIIKTKNAEAVKSYVSTILGCQKNEISLQHEFVLPPDYKNKLEEAKIKYGNIIPDISNIYRLNYKSDYDELILSQKLSKLDFVEYCEPLYKIDLLYVPNDPLNSSDQYWLQNIKAFEAWDIHKGDTNTVIGISDTGIDLSHPDLIYNIRYNYLDPIDGVDNDSDGYIDNFRGWNFGENNNNVQASENPHGTYVSGIAGASTDNGIGVSGAGFKCKILPLKIMNSQGVIDNAYQSIIYAALHGVDVINCSWGSTYYQQMGQEVVTYATLVHDLLIVAAAGNTNSEVEFYPASYEYVISVAGTTSLDERWSPENTPTGAGSSYSYSVDISAPSAMFKSTDNGGGYTLMWGGTSFAAPIVSGAAAILRSYYPQLTALEIIEHLKNTADIIDTILYNIPYANKLGKGRLNLYRALSEDFSPSVKFRNLFVNETANYVTLNGNFQNLLAPVENLKVNISLIADYCEIVNDILEIGTLEASQIYVSDNEIVIQKNQNIPYDYEIIVKFDYVGNNYSDKQFVKIRTNPGYKNINTDKILLSVTPNGRIGYSDLSGSIGNGMIFDNIFSLFYDCGIITGNSALNLKSSIRQSPDFKNFIFPYYVNNWDLHHCRVVLNDSLDVSPNGLEIICDYYAWEGEENKNFIIADFKLVNKGLYDQNNFYFGIFTDWDLINPSRNSIGSIPEHNFVYCRSDVNQNLYAGIKVLNSQNVKNYFIPQISGGDGVVDLTNGLEDLERFYMISNESFSYTGSSDIVGVTSTGPFNLLAGDTVTIGMAFVVADNLFDLNNALIQSQDLYFNELYPQFIANENIKEFKIFPNPAIDKLFIDCKSCTNSKFAVYDIFGKPVLNGDLNTYYINLNSLNTGIYFLEIYSTDEIVKTKFIKHDLK
ncbi:MAG: S8 family serine peptidase [Bacteroidales bacterium]|jgi:subtilisin family serine protease